jgi:hypothetical protein
VFAHRRRSLVASVAFFFTATVLAMFVMSCGSSSSAQGGGVTIEPIPSSTPAGLALLGGKPATPPAQPADTPAPTEAAAPPADTLDATPTSTAAEAPTSDASVAPAEGRWIDVDVTQFVVRLMDGSSVVQEIAPVAVGAQIDTGEYASTQTGLFHVYNKAEDLAYDPPYDTYISDWVGFDPDKANGFHSFLKDKDGKVVDPSTGRVSNGCIRTGAEDEIFAFAEVGMPVWVHW